MSETNKPFACPNEGCQMTFTNEDHLSVHQKKHEMFLHLGLVCKNNAFADQTPTPTRFLRNCEEVGLFQDLQNVNPFEETFRQAIEHSKNGLLHVPDQSSDDTLHTPHIFPHIIEENIDKFRQTSNDDHQPQEFSISNVPAIDQDLIRINAKDTNSNMLNDESIDLTNNDETEDSNSNPTKKINSLIQRNSSNTVLKNSNTNLLDQTALKFGSPAAKGADKKLHVREKIKVALQNKQQDILLKSPVRSVGDFLETENKSYLPDRCSLILPKRPRRRIGLNSKLKKGESCADKNKHTFNFYDKNLSETEKRRAMNRVAQMRSRERKKIWLDQLESEIFQLKLENRKLAVENQSLKDENVLLKTVLLNHNSCSLTSLTEVQTLLNAQRLRQTQSDKKLALIIPKVDPKNLSTPTSMQAVALPIIPKIIFTPVTSMKRKLPTDDQAKQLPKLLLKTCVVGSPNETKTDGNHLKMSQSTRSTTTIHEIVLPKSS